MKQRQPRLGDIVDDYCPRERRVTNHAVVAMVDDDIKQTRCTTCEAEHEYKRAKIPVSRRKKEASALVRELEADAPKPPEPAAPEPQETGADASQAAAVQSQENKVVIRDEEPESTPRAAGPDAPAGEGHPPPAQGVDEGRVHRRLIRATLPRTEGQVVTRPTPQFTIRQSPQGGRGAGFSGKGRGGGGGSGRTQGASHGGPRQHAGKGARHTFGRGPEQPFGRGRGRDGAAGRPRGGRGRTGKKPSK